MLPHLGFVKVSSADFFFWVAAIKSVNDNVASLSVCVAGVAAAAAAAGVATASAVVTQCSAR